MENEWFDHTATYSPEDNKLRIYPGSRIDNELTEDEYKEFKAAGYRWAAKQECFVCPRWTPTAEDWALRLAGEIGDEDYSYEERAADRAERFTDYRDKRAGEAGAHADTFEAGPSAFGHQNRARAERQARRHDRHRGHAVSQWSKAEYWQHRTAGVIRHALYKSSAHVRRGRILAIEADQRKHAKSREEYAKRYAAWQRVLTLEGGNEPIGPVADWRRELTAESSPAAKLAYMLANSSQTWGDYKHPRQDRTTSLYMLLSDVADPITPYEAAALWLDGKSEPDSPDSGPARWAAHYELRLTYERAMLAEEGGTAAEAEIEPGGWFGRHQVLKVNKSPATGRVVSVGIWGPHDWRKNADGTPQMGIQNLNVERMGEGAYRPPTEEERAAFAASQAAAKKERAAKAKANPAPSLINPTDNDAERLQAAWNAAAAARHARENERNHGTLRDYVPSQVLRMTQAEYAEKSKGGRSSYETAAVCENGLTPRKWDERGHRATNPPIAFKIRQTYPSGGWSASAHRVIVITDKPQKPLPLDWAKVFDSVTEVAKAC